MGKGVGQLRGGERGNGGFARDAMRIDRRGERRERERGREIVAITVAISRDLCSRM
jgi:hypothetical protein